MEKTSDRIYVTLNKKFEKREFPRYLNVYLEHNDMSYLLGSVYNATVDVYFPEVLDVGRIHPEPKIRFNTAKESIDWIIAHYSEYGLEFYESLGKRLASLGEQTKIFDSSAYEYKGKDKDLDYRISRGYIQ